MTLSCPATAFRRPALMASFVAAHSAAFSTIPMANTRTEYSPPLWTHDLLLNVPSHRLTLANLPTPLYKMPPPPPSSLGGSGGPSSILQSLVDHGISLYIKRDDMTGGVEIGGNKIRKLEFLLADALDGGYDSVVTIGGEQSNHCRATAAACRMVGLDSNLILRTRRANAVQEGKSDFGFTGNILFDRIVGSSIYTCTPGEYGRVGSDGLVERLCSFIRSQSTSEKENKPYAIPVGGSNALGSWGYLNGVEEVLQQWKVMRENDGSVPSLDHVVFACGSGGTAAGISLGMALARPTKPTVHAIGVCDDPDYFYGHVAKIADDMGLVLPSYLPTEEFIRQHMVAHQGKGLGYASSTPEELDFVSRFAIETGIALDPVYSGKALYHFITHVLEEDPESYRGKTVLFWHTGGSLGLFDKGDALLPTLNEISPVKRLDVYGKDGDNGAISI